MKGGGRTKNLRYGIDDDIFDKDIAGVVDDDDMEPVFEIDTDVIDKEAGTIATGTVLNVTKIYASEDFLANHPDFRKRLDSEIKSLKMLYKMLSIDEKIQDELVRAIGRKGDNASLYATLPKIQAQMTNTQNKIDDTLDRIRDLLRGYQTEIPFEDEEEEAEEDDSTSILKPIVTRGTRDFIEKFKNMSSQTEEAADDEANNA